MLSSQLAKTELWISAAWTNVGWGVEEEEDEDVMLENRQFSIVWHSDNECDRNVDPLRSSRFKF